MGHSTSTKPNNTKRWYWKFLLLLVLGSVSWIVLLVVRLTLSVVQPQESKPKKCALHNGIIIANLHGRLGNNLFQIAMANRLAQDLCWPVVYKEGWQGKEFLQDPSRALECFPNTGMSAVDQQEPQPQTYDSEWFGSMKIDSATNHTWNNPKVFFQQLPHHDYDQLYQQWWKQSLNDGTLLRIGSPWEFNYTMGWDNDLVERLRNPGEYTFVTNYLQDNPQQQKQQRYDSVRTVLMDAYYIHYGWIQPRIESIRKWHAMDETKCCRDIPPEHAVVIHIRNFMYWEDDLNPDFKISVYEQVLDRYYFGTTTTTNQHYVLWIVCQPGDTQIALVKTLQQRYNGTIIVTGDDPYDAFCTLQKAQHLILSTHSTFSQMAALLANDNAQVHYLLPTLHYPRVTLVVPHWNYHLVEPVKKDAIQTWNVPVHTILPMVS